MKKLSLLLSILVSTFVFGCAHSSRIVTGNPRPSLSEDSVKIYSSMPKRAEEIAIVNGVDAWLQLNHRAVSEMKKQAARVGANGLLIENSNLSGWTGAQVTGKAVYVH